MKYSKKDIELFEKMFVIERKFGAYYYLCLRPYGLEEKDMSHMDHNTSMAMIELSNGNVYMIKHGESEDPEGHALDAFNQFVTVCNYDEEKFEKYLQEESSFNLA